MPSQKTLIWAGAAVATLVVAGTGGGALVWTHPDLVWPSRDLKLVEARSPERVTPSPPPAPPVGHPAAPAAGNETASAPPGVKPAPVVVAPPNTEPPAVKPAFDVVTVEPTGEAVIAGRAAPNAKVELRDAGKTVAEATADASGQFVMIPPRLAPGDHSLSLAAAADQAVPETSNAVAVSVPAPKAAATAPAKTVTAPPSPPALAMRTLATTPTTAASRVIIKSVEADGAGALIARGSAEPNSDVRLYLNGAAVGDAKLKSDGRWSLTIRRGMAPGAYAVHAEEVNPPGATVVASAEIRFDYPAAPASAGATNAANPQSSGPSSADVVLELDPDCAGRVRPHAMGA